MKPYSASTFMGWWDWLQRWLPLEGMHCRLDRRDFGTIISADESMMWKHPWTIVPRLRDVDGKQEWIGTIEPGFVNGQDAKVFDIDRAEWTDLTDEKSPELRLGWRDALRAGASTSGESFTTGEDVTNSPGKGYPIALKGKGIKLPASEGTGLPEDVGRNTRELRACDVALVVPRIGTKQSVSIGDLIGDQQIVQISTSLNTDEFARNGDKLYRIIAFDRWAPPFEPSYLDRLLGRTVEPTTDEIKLMTIWAVSPEDASQDDQPGPGWELLPDYDVFWNLMHASQQQVPVVPPTPLRIITGLAAGAGDALIASILDPINDAYNAISEMFANATFKGRFWSI